MNKPIRILHVFHGMNCGGAETMIMNLYRQIDRNKVQFDFLVHTNEKCFFDNEINELGGKIYRVPYFNGVNFLSYTKALKSFFKNHSEYKVVHGHVASSAAIYLHIAKKYGLYTIAHSHSTKAQKLSLKNFIYQLYAYPTRFIAQHFFACSVDSGTVRYGKKVINSEKFQVIKNAIDVLDYKFDESVRNELRKELNIEGKFVIGHIGSFREVKNHMFLIDVFNEYLKINKNAVLLLIGDGNLKKKIKDKLVMYGIIDSVIFTGIRKDVNRLLQAMDCFVFPSLYEGLGIVVIEAQASGLNCLISDTIPKEVALTDLVKRKSLSICANEWAKEISLMKTVSERKTYNDLIIKSGYDISNTVGFIEKFYIDNSKENYYEN